MSKGYTKREFLRIMGLGIAFMPFIGCFDNSSSDKKTEAKADDPGGKTDDGGKIKVTDADVLMLTRNDASYASFNEGFNKRIKHLPKYIALCKTEQGVRFAVQKAKTEGLKVAVKSGGHSFEGFSSNDGGMVINLSQMKKITWLENNEVLVEPGCLLQDIQAA
ncbi:MAG: FAD-binding oxidoreductase, partial [Sphingobacteriales bacterium]